MEKFIRYLKGLASVPDDVHVDRIRLMDAPGDIEGVSSFTDIEVSARCLALGACHGASPTEEIIRTVAHEFRHLDQWQHPDKLPQPNAPRSLALDRPKGWEESYYKDPGEHDAEDFSELALELATPEVKKDVRDSLARAVVEIIKGKKEVTMYDDRDCWGPCCADCEYRNQPYKPCAACKNSDEDDDKSILREYGKKDE